MSEMGEIIAEHDSPLPAVIEAAPTTLFGTDDPDVVLERAKSVAKSLASVIEEQKLYTQIQNKRHIRVEGWTLLGSMLGVFPETEWTRRTVDSKGAEAYEARVVARTRDGSVVGAREAMCSRSEARWKNADDYALRSMAQTRAVSGALAAPLRFVVVLAGYEGTPEAEMPHGGAQTADTGTKDPRTWAEIETRGKAQLEDDWAVWFLQAKKWSDAVKARTGKPPSPSPLQRMAAIVRALEDAKVDWAFVVDTRAKLQEIFAAHLDGEVLEGPEHALNGDDGDPDALLLTDPDLGQIEF